MDKEHISVQQCMLLITGFGIGTSLLLLPTILVQFAGQGANISTALALIPSIILIMLLASLNKWYPNQSLVQYSQTILGLPGKIVGLIFIWFAFYLSALVLRNIGDFIALTMLAETPTPVVYTVVVAITGIALLYGLETASRALSILICLAISFSFMLLVFTLPNANFSNMLPLMGTGWSGIIKGFIYISSFPVGEFVLFGMFIFNINDSTRAALPLIKGQFIATIIFSFVLIEIITNMNIDRASRAVIAIVSTLNSIHGSNLLLIPFALTWFIFAIVKFFVCYYSFVVGLSHWVHMEDYRPLILPSGALIICIAIILFTGVGEHQAFNRLYWPVYSIPLEYGIPLILWLAAGAKRLLKISDKN